VDLAKESLLNWLFYVLGTSDTQLGEKFDERLCEIKRFYIKNSVFLWHA